MQQTKPYKFRFAAIKFFSLAILLSAVFISCDEEPVDIPPFIVPESDRVVLIEDFTGVQCVNCPNASRQIESLLQTFDGNLVAVAIHTDALGDPLSDSKYDFRTEEGNLLERDIDILLAKPVAVINRQPTGADGLFNYTLGTWASAVSEELESFAELSIEQIVDYNEATRELELTVNFTPKENISRPLRLTVGITESGIVDPQIDVDGEVKNYVHDHVLRSFLTNYTGDLIEESTLLANQTYTRTFSYQLPPEDGWWVADKCHILAFVTEQTADSRAVLQASEVDIVQ